MPSQYPIEEELFIVKTMEGTLDRLNRITIPRTFAKRAHLWPEGPVSITLEGNEIILRHSPRLCFLCGGEEELIPIHTHYPPRQICTACVFHLRSI